MSDVLSRRTFVGKLAVGAAVAATAGAAAQAVSAREQLGAPAGEAPQASGGPWLAESAPQSAPPWELLAPLSAGAAVTAQWRVTELSGVRDGSCVLTLANGQGRTQRIHLCANAGRPHGVVHTARVDLVVMNGGQGDLPTEEGFAQAVAAVAHVIAANEGGRAAAVVATLAPHAERLEQFAAAAQLR